MVSSGKSKFYMIIDSADCFRSLGPVGLTAGTTPEPTIPTVTNQLFANGIIGTESFGIFFTPATANSTVGELTFGGFNTTNTRSPIHFVPITETPPSSAFWGINQSIAYGSTTLLNNGAGVVDPGPTLFSLATGMTKSHLHLLLHNHDAQ
jgi:pepsin A